MLLLSPYLVRYESVRYNQPVKKVSQSGDFFGIIETGDKDVNEGTEAATVSGNAVYGYAGTEESFAEEDRRGSGFRYDLRNR